MLVTDAHAALFRERGFLVFESAIPAEDIDALRRVCMNSLAMQMADMDRVGTDVLGLTQRERRYFLSYRHEDNPALKQFLFSELVASIVGPLLGENAFLFLHLFVSKWPKTGTGFEWHQDSGYVMGNPHRPYVTLWCALDDMTVANGALRVLPYDRAPTTNVVCHRKDRQSGDLVGDAGDDPGDIVEVQSGSIIALASNTFHCSGPNVTANHRRALVASYSPEPITAPSGELWNLAEPFIRDGRRLA